LSDEVDMRAAVMRNKEIVTDTLADPVRAR
jgi:hypothetical protein